MRAKIEGKYIQFDVTGIENILGQVMVHGKYGGFNIALIELVYRKKDLV